MSSEQDFKNKNRPASCTQPPWASIIPADIREETLHKIRQETIEAYGYSMDECTKRLVCFSQNCLGRELPWLSETAKPYLEKMKSTQNIVNDELVLTNCDLCPIAKICKSTCAQVNDFMGRDRINEPELVYRENLDNIEVDVEAFGVISRILGNHIKVPWDAINKTRRDVIKKYLYEQKDFLTVAKELGLQDQARARYEFYAGLTTLSEYGTFRTFLEEKGDTLTKHQREILVMVYRANLNTVQVAKVLETSKQAVQQVISRITEKHGIKWTVFVKKDGNKLVYHVPELLK